MPLSQRISRLALAAFTFVAMAMAAAAPAHAAPDRYNRNVLIVNQTGQTIREFYASRVTTDDWEEDILGQDVLRAGSSVRVNIDDGTGSCRFDFKAVLADGSSIIRNNINVCEINSFTFRGDQSAGGTAGDNQDRRVRIYNDAGETMREFYASRVTTDDWEEDILGQDVLRAGSSVMINIDDGTGACLFDFKAVFVSGREAIRNRINVCQISDYHFTGDAAKADNGGGSNDGRDRRVSIINARGSQLREFYATSTDTNDWGEDLLGSGVIRPGQRSTIDVDDGNNNCMYDFKAVFADGRVIVRRAINACQISEYRFSN
ncbi:MAG: hypothetical protein U1E50_14155 [Caulobacteraceae bacterium]